MLFRPIMVSIRVNIGLSIINVLFLFLHLIYIRMAFCFLLVSGWPVPRFGPPRSHKNALKIVSSLVAKLKLMW